MRRSPPAQLQRQSTASSSTASAAFNGMGSAGMSVYQDRLERHWATRTDATNLFWGAKPRACVWERGIA